MREIAPEQVIAFLRSRLKAGDSAGQNIVKHRKYSSIKPRNNKQQDRLLPIMNWLKSLKTSDKWLSLDL